jgi:diadenosine tetraphosphate (Ap4A) HIT family hydrolase
VADTIFDKILRGEISSYKVWEDDAYLAFLTPFPNTPGVTVVIPKTYEGDYIFTLDLATQTAFMGAITKVARLLEKAFATSRIAIVFEGTGFAYVHAKLYPLTGDLASKTDVTASHTEFYPQYAGYVTTIEGPQMNTEELTRIQALILAQV